MEGDVVQTEVMFTKLKIVPVRFWRGTREYRVQAVTIRFERIDGGKKYLCFGIDTGGMVVELRYDTKEFNWRLVEE